MSAWLRQRDQRNPTNPNLKTTNQENSTVAYGSMWANRVAACQGKKYILLLSMTKTYSRFTWVKVLALKRSNAPAFIINFLNDESSENLGKLQPKADIGIFIGYAPTKKAFRIYNRRTRRIIETIHVDFDELTAMASEHSSSGPALHEMTPVSISSGLVPNPSPSTPFVPPSRSDWDLLFQPMFDESPNVDLQAPEVIAPIPEAVAPEHAVSTGSPSSTTVDQDAPSPSNSHTTQETQTPIISHDVEEDNHDIEVAHMGNDPYFGIPIPESNPKLTFLPNDAFLPKDVGSEAMQEDTPEFELWREVFLKNMARLVSLVVIVQEEAAFLNVFMGLKQAPRALFDMLVLHSGYPLTSPTGSVDPTLIYPDRWILLMVEKSNCDEIKRTYVDHTHRGFESTEMHLNAVKRMFGTKWTLPSGPLVSEGKDSPLHYTRIADVVGSCWLSDTAIKAYRHPVHFIKELVENGSDRTLLCSIRIIHWRTFFTKAVGRGKELISYQQRWGNCILEFSPDTLKYWLMKIGMNTLVG
ncbi:retrovirus-related pol polyprotein from transposon TNT 1-94 [Tanacetum coccineum]